MEKLLKRHLNLITQTEFGFERYLLNKLPWDNRLIGVKGARGVGKTTMLLQYIKKNTVYLQKRYIFHWTTYIFLRTH